MISGLREEIHFYMVKMGISILPDILMESIKNSQLPQGPPPQVNMGYQTFFLATEIISYIAHFNSMTLTF